MAKHPEPGEGRARRRQATAVWFSGPLTVELRSEPVDDPGPGELRVRALTSGISAGTEMLVYRGQVLPEMELDLPTLRGGFGFPIKYGYAGTGRVVATGPDVRLREGDLVFALHPHQDEYVVPAALTMRLPQELPAEAGIFAANVETAVNVALDAAIRLGERVAVFGQGVVGLLITQLLRRCGAEAILAIDPIPARRELALKLGADVALDPGGDVVGEVRRLTGGIGLDTVIEVSGQGTALAQAIDCLAFQGTIVVGSWYGTKAVTLPLGGAFHRRRLRLVSSQVGTIDPGLQARWSRERRTALVQRLLPELGLLPLVTHRFPLRQAAAAYRLIDEHPEEVVQVVFTYGDDDV